MKTLTEIVKARMSEDPDFNKNAETFVIQLTDLLEECQGALDFYSKHHHWLKTTSPNFAQEALSKLSQFKKELSGERDW